MNNKQLLNACMAGSQQLVFPATIVTELAPLKSLLNVAEPVLFKLTVTGKVDVLLRFTDNVNPLESLSYRDEVLVLIDTLGQLPKHDPLLPSPPPDEAPTPNKAAIAKDESATLGTSVARVIDGFSFKRYFEFSIGIETAND